MERGKILIFSKFPEIRKVKSRLHPHLSYEEILSFYKKLLDKTITNSTSANIKTELWFDYDIDKYKSIDNFNGLNVKKQCSGDLGKKMLFSINLSIKEGYNPILIGCDCPLISQKDFLFTLNFLKKKDIVIKPTYDGGFCLISLRKVHADLFKNIEWGTSQVFKALVKNILNINFSYKILSPTIDIDHFHDYLRIKKRVLYDSDLRSLF